MKFIKVASIVVVTSVALALAGQSLAKVEKVSGAWIISAPQPMVFSCGGGTYAHTLNTVSQDANGDFSGTGEYDANSGYTWDITGNVVGDDVAFTLAYTGINSGYTLNGDGTIAADGSIEGTTDGNCQAFEMPVDTAVKFTGNHGQYVKSQEDKKAAAQSRVGMPVKSKGHTK